MTRIARIALHILLAQLRLLRHLGAGFARVADVRLQKSGVRAVHAGIGRAAAADLGDRIGAGGRQLGVGGGGRSGVGGATVGGRASGGWYGVSWEVGFG